MTEPRSEEGWRPIETAPKGKVIDVWQIEHWSQFKNRDGMPSDLGETIRARRLTDVFWVEDGVDFFGNPSSGWSRFKMFVEDPATITHWMPLPPPPAPEGK